MSDWIQVFGLCVGFLDLMAIAFVLLASQKVIDAFRDKLVSYALFLLIINVVYLSVSLL